MDLSLYITIAVVLLAAIISYLILIKLKKNYRVEKKDKSHKPELKLEKEKIDVNKVQKLDLLLDDLDVDLNTNKEEPSPSPPETVVKPAPKVSSGSKMKFRKRERKKINIKSEQKRAKSKKYQTLKNNIIEENNPLKFTLINQEFILPDVWNVFFVYLWKQKEYKNVQADFSSRKALFSREIIKETTNLSQHIIAGDIITIIPFMEDFMFMPDKEKFVWLDDWKCTEFKIKPKENIIFNKPYFGKISLYVGPVLFADIDFSVIIKANSDEIPGEMNFNNKEFSQASENMTKFYRKIFASYSRKDTEIVKPIESAFKIIGDDYYRDVNILRSGEEWEPKILEFIEQADIFQLFWSESSSGSVNVEKEWKYAHELNRKSFIRPVYWETPMPDRPDELRKINFSHLEINKSQDINIK